MENLQNTNRSGILNQNNRFEQTNKTFEMSVQSEMVSAHAREIDSPLQYCPADKKLTFKKIMSEYQLIVIEQYYNFFQKLLFNGFT